MKISGHLGVLAAVLYGLNVHVYSRALPGTSLSLREYQNKVEDITLLETRNLLFGRAPGFVAPKPVPKSGPHGGSSRDSSSSSSGSGDGDPSTGGGVRIGADDSGGSPSSDSSDSSGGVRLGADNPGKPTSGDQSGDPQPNVRPGGGDTSSGGDTGNQQAGQAKKLAGGSKPGDNGVATLGESKDIGRLKTKGQQVDGELQQVLRGNNDDKITLEIEVNYQINPKISKKPLDHADGENKDIVTPFEDLKVDLGKSNYIEYQVWSDEIGDKPISVGKYFAKDGVIVGQTRFAEADLNPPAEKMISSDQVFQQWRKANLVKDNEAATLEATKKLKGFVGRDIQALGKNQITEITAYPRTYDPQTKSGMEKITIGVKFKKIP